MGSDFREYPEYTDMRRTRVVERGSVYTRPRENPTIGHTQLIAKKEGLFDGLSIPQVVASAAAAATSMLLASKIGIAGSVIGAAVSSVVTIVATQLYRRALTAGAQKLQEASFDTAGQRSETNPYGIEHPGAATPYDGAVRGARIAPTKLQARAAAQRANMQRKITAASIAIAIIAVAGMAAVILLGTSGEGLGTRPEPMFNRTGISHAEDQPSKDAKPTSSASMDKDSASTQDDAAAQEQKPGNANSDVTGPQQDQTAGGSPSDTSSNQGTASGQETPGGGGPEKPNDSPTDSSQPAGTTGNNATPDGAAAGEPAA